MVPHPYLPFNGFVICHICGTHAEKEENEISRHYRVAHEHTHPQFTARHGGSTPYHLLKIVPQAAAIDLVGQRRVTQLNGRTAYTNVNAAPKSSFATAGEIAALYILAGQAVPAWVATVTWPPTANAPAVQAAQPVQPHVPVIQVQPPQPPAVPVPVQHAQAPNNPPPPPPSANPGMAGPLSADRGMLGPPPGLNINAHTHNAAPANPRDDDADYEEEEEEEEGDEEEDEFMEEGEAVAPAPPIVEEQASDDDDADTIALTASRALPSLNDIPGSVEGHDEPQWRRGMTNYSCHIHRRANTGPEPLIEGHLREMFNHYNQWHPQELCQALASTYKDLYEEELRTRAAAGRTPLPNGDGHGMHCYLCMEEASDFDELDSHFREEHEVERWTVVETIFDRWAHMEGVQYPRWVEEPRRTAPPTQTSRANGSQRDQGTVAQDDVEVEDAAMAGLEVENEDDEEEESEEE